MVNWWKLTLPDEIVSRFPYAAIGTILGAHGAAGEVAVLPASHPSEIQCGMTVWAVPPGEDSGPLIIESVKPGPKGLLVRLSSVECRSQASTLRGTRLIAASSELPHALDDDFTTNPIGYKVVDERLGEIGVINEVIHTGANDVWVVEEGRWNQVLIPVIDDVIQRMDPDSGTVNVRLLDGLISEDLIDEN